MTWQNDTQHLGNRRNDIQPNNTQHTNIKQSNIQHNGEQHNKNYILTFTLSFFSDECHYADCLGTQQFDFLFNFCKKFFQNQRDGADITSSNILTIILKVEVPQPQRVKLKGPNQLCDKAP